MENNVTHPSHYTQGKIEVIDFIQDKKLDFARGNVVKYVVRAGHKPEGDAKKELEDLQKAKQYIEFAIRKLGGDEQVEQDAKEGEQVPSGNLWKPKDGEIYYVPYFNDSDHPVHEYRWEGDSCDVRMYEVGLVCKTVERAGMVFQRLVESARKINSDG